MTLIRPRTLLLAAVMIPVAALAKTKSTGGGTSTNGKGLPPKFGGLIQPAPAPAEGDKGGNGIISSELSGRDLEFLQNTIELGRLQSYLVETAKAKAATPEVQSLGGALAEIQSDENKYVARLAAGKGVVVPTPTAPAPAQKKAEAELGKLSGAKLEKALMEEIVSSAQKSVNQYETAMHSSDPDIKRLAEQMLPAAKSRLQFASKASGRSLDTSSKPSFRTGSATPEPRAATPASKSAAPTVSHAPEVKATPAANPKPTPAPSVAKPAETPAASAPSSSLTPPPRPPKPTPVAEGAVMPKSPTPPDFTAPARTK
jgi:predicted outer membrane protein